MAINIKTKPTAPDTASAHDEAAASIETETSITETKDGKDTVIHHEITSEPCAYGNPDHPFERIDVGVSFKMPVAEYTMLTFSVRRSIPYQAPEQEPDAVFETAKGWVEEKINLMISEQQEPGEAG